MSYLLLMLFYYFDPFESFLYFANLIVANEFMRDLYTFNMHRVYAYSRLFDSRLAQRAPELTAYFESQAINTMTFSVDWFYTLFSRAFEVNIVRAVWDMHFLFGSEFVVNAGVALMTILKDEMMTNYMNEGFNFVRVRTGKIKVSEILAESLRHKLDTDEYLYLLEAFHSEPNPYVKNSDSY